MSDLPILFSAPMVRAILREIEQPGTGKTQTRRVLKPQPPEWATFCQEPHMLNIEHRWVPSGLWRWSEKEQNPPRPLRQWPVDEEGEHYWLRPPFSRRDRLWMREEHFQFGHWEIDPDKLTKGGREKWRFVPDQPEVVLVPPKEYRSARRARDPATPAWHKRLGRFMFRAHSRLTLYVTDVRVERLNDISEADAIKEGIETDHAAGMQSVWGWRDYLRGDSVAKRHFADPRESYRTLWDAINGPGAWEANPWVVAYSFVPRLGNIDTLTATLQEAA